MRDRPQRTHLDLTAQAKTELAEAAQAEETDTGEDDTATEPNQPATTGEPAEED